MKTASTSMTQRLDGLDYLPRPQLLVALRKALAQTGRAAVVDECPSSLGLGKTELAAAYVREFGHEYANVFWLRADRPAVFRAEFAELALRLGSAEQFDHDRTAMSTAVEHWLKKTDSWLLVADGAKDVMELNQLIADVPTGHLIVTTRSRDCPPPFTCVHAAGFESLEIGEYLNDREGELGRLNGNSNVLAMMRVPLVAHLIAAYRRNSNTSLTEVAELLAVESSHDSSEESPGDPARVLIPLLKRNLDLLKPEDKAASQLALLCAQLDSGFISPGLLANERAFLPSELSERLADIDGISSVFGSLADFGLLRSGIDSVTMHSAIQQAVLLQQPDAEKREWTKRTIRLVTDAFVHEEHYQGYLGACSRLIGTVLGVSELCIQLDCELDVAGTLLNRVGQYLYGFGDYAAARESLEYSARIAARLEGHHSPNVALRLNNLGAAELAASDHESALARFEQALLIIKGQEKSHKNLTSEVLRNLANAHLARKDLDSARICLKQALHRHLRNYGRNHKYVAECFNQLGIVFNKSGRAPQSLKSFEHAVCIGRTAEGCGQAQLASYLVNLGRALRKHGDLERAEACLAEALELRRSVFGEFNEGTTEILVQLGRVMRRRKNFDGAIDCFERAFQSPSGVDPEKTWARVAQELGRTHLLNGNHQAAFEWFSGSLALYDAIGNTSTSTLIEVLLDTSNLALNQDNENVADTLLHRALDLHRTGYERDAHRLAEIVSGIGEVEERRGNYAASLEHYNRALFLCTKEHGKNHPAVASEALNVARCLRKLGRGFEAVANVVHAERIFTETLGDRHSKTRRARELLERFRN